MRAGRPAVSSCGTDQPVAGWRTAIGQATGPGHRRTGTECQDRCGWAGVTSDMLVLAVADGAGSRRYSARGAAHAIEATCEAAQRTFAGGVPASIRGWGSQLMALQRRTFEAFDDRVERELYELQRAPSPDGPQGSDDYATTLCVVVVAPHALGYLSIGDSFVVALRDPGGAQLIVPPPLDRDSAGITTFLTSSNRDDASKRGAMVDDRIVGLALSTDGLLEALLKFDIDPHVGPFLVAPRDMASYFEKLVSGEIDDDRLGRTLASQSFAVTSDDDKTLLLAVRA